MLKDIFKGAATTVITQQNKDPIYADCQRMLDLGIKLSLAKLALLRKTSVTVLCMWKNEEEYRLERIRRSMTPDHGA